MLPPNFHRLLTQPASVCTSGELSADYTVAVVTSASRRSLLPILEFSAQLKGHCSIGDGCLISTSRGSLLALSNLLFLLIACLTICFSLLLLDNIINLLFKIEYPAQVIYVLKLYYSSSLNTRVASTAFCQPLYNFSLSSLSISSWNVFSFFHCLAISSWLSQKPTANPAR